MARRCIIYAFCHGRENLAYIHALPGEVRIAEEEPARNRSVRICRRKVVEWNEVPTSDSDNCEFGARGSRKAPKASDILESE